MGDLLNEFDPLKASAKPPPKKNREEESKLVNVFDKEAAKFASLTGIDRATAAIHLRAAQNRGFKFEEAVDRYYQNNGAHVRETTENADEAAISRQRTRREQGASDAALARALAEEDRESLKLERAFDEIVAQLEDMGFEKKLALQAVQRTKGLEDATNYCLQNVEKREAPKREITTTTTTAAAAANDGRMAAMRIQKFGKLYKLSSSKAQCRNQI